MKKYLKGILKSLVICSFSFFSIVLTSTFFIDVTFASPNVQLLWEAEVELPVWTTFSEPWFTAIDPIDGDITYKVIIDGVVDSTTLGEYFIHYTVENSEFLTDEKIRKITVIDDVNPVIYLYWSESMEVLIGNQYVDQGAYYFDNYYWTGYLQSEWQVDTSQISENKLSYYYTDPSWNVADVVYRTVYANSWNTPIITILWDNPLYLEYQNQYVEPWISVVDIEDWIINSENVFVTWSIDTNTLWEYFVSYYVSDSHTNVQFEQRQVFVADLTEPVITLQGNDRVYIEKWIGYEDAWALRTDNYDGTWTLSGSGYVDTSTLWEYVLEYSFMDSNLNVAPKKIRTISVINSSNFYIELIGENILTLQQYSAYSESGATAQDIYKSDISSDIIVDGEVNTNVLGTYYITYTVADPFLHTTKSVTRTVQVESWELWRTSSSSNTTISSSYISWSLNPPKLYTFTDTSFEISNSSQTITWETESPFQWTGTQQWDPIVGVLQPAQNIENQTMLVPSPASQYFDDIGNSFAQEYINTLAEQWFLETQTRLFNPTGNISRAEFLNLLFKIHTVDIESFPPKQEIFVDIQSETLQSKIANTAYSLWISDWYSDGTFRPNDNISRIQAVKYILKLNKEELIDEGSYFIDVPIQWMVKYANAAKKLWITDGEDTLEGLKFYPEKLITREETAKFLYKSK